MKEVRTSAPDGQFQREHGPPPHWLAPERLQESPGVELVPAQVTGAAHEPLPGTQPPALHCLADRDRQADLMVVASGGIVSGLDIAKSIALGADLAASARPILTALARGGMKGMRALVADWRAEMRGAMFLTGSRTVSELRHAQLMEFRP